MPQNHEIIKTIAKVAVPTLLTAGLLELGSRYSFERATAKEIGNNYEWTCQGLGHYGCYWDAAWGKPANFFDGEHVQIAHYPELHGKYNDNVLAGRPLCTCCHGLESILMGRPEDAQMLLEGQTVYAYGELKRRMKLNGHPDSSNAQLAHMLPYDVIVGMDDLYDIIEQRRMRFDYNPRIPLQRVPLEPRLPHLINADMDRDGELNLSIQPQSRTNTVLYTGQRHEELAAR